MMERDKNFHIAENRKALKNCEVDLSIVDVTLNPDAEDPNVYRVMEDKPY